MCLACEWDALWTLYREQMEAAKGSAPNEGAPSAADPRIEQAPTSSRAPRSQFPGEEPASE